MVLLCSSLNRSKVLELTIQNICNKLHLNRLVLLHNPIIDQITKKTKSIFIIELFYILNNK